MKPKSFGLYLWISCWLDLICGLIGVITFTLWRPLWNFSFTIWYSKKELIKKIKGGK